MIRLPRKHGGPWIAAVLFVFLPLLPSFAQDQKQESSLPEGYVGAETCAGCHEDIAKSFEKNPHHALTGIKYKKFQDRACEACHGPGAKHAESMSAADIKNPAKLKPADVDQICLGCHRNQPTRVGHLQNGHARSWVPCTSCHTVHKTGEESSTVRFRRASGINAKCASCHEAEWAAFLKPHHHRLPEGAMACTDCHNPHGSLLPNNMKMVNANEPGCFQCHSDKRGPFLFEHAPVRTDPCSTCHEPHGSANPRMLIRSVVTTLCLECHSDILSPSAANVAGGTPPAIHDFRIVKWRNCTICHQKIHGSNANRGLLR
jgi:DmsE family decaheme c-type cytochrome